MICGTAAGEQSAARGAYYAGPGNQFWGVLERTGLTDTKWAPERFRDLPSIGIGLTDVEQRRAGMDRVALQGTLPVAEFLARVTAAAPEIVAFNGKRAAEEVLGRAVTYGPQEERIGEAAVWVLPSTSGAARGAWQESIWVAFASLVKITRVQQQVPAATPQTAPRKPQGKARAR